MTEDKHVLSILVDNRSNRPSDFHAAIAATATGTVEEVTGEVRDRLLALYLAKHRGKHSIVTEGEL